MDRVVKLAGAVVDLSVAAYRNTGDARIRLCSDRGALVCEITDPGVSTDPMICGRLTSCATSCNPVLHGRHHHPRSTPGGEQPVPSCDRGQVVS